MDAVNDEITSRRSPLESAVNDIGRSGKVLEAALETLEDKIKEPQHEFIQRFVPMIEVSDFRISAEHSNNHVFQLFFEARSRTTACTKMLFPCLHQQCD